MLRVWQVSGTAALALAGALVVSGVPDASAQRLSYEQAYARCKQEVVAAYPAGSSDSVGRAARGGACMKQLGYNLKKGAKF